MKYFYLFFFFNFDCEFNFFLKSCNNEADHQFSVEASKFFEIIIQSLQVKHSRLIKANDSLEAYRLQRSIDSFKYRYARDPKILYKNVRDAITFETEMLGLTFDVIPPDSDNERIHQIMDRLGLWLLLHQKTIEQFEIYHCDDDDFMQNLIKQLKCVSDINDVIFLRINDCLNRWEIHRHTLQSHSIYEGDEGLNMIQQLFRDFGNIISTTRNYLSNLINIGYKEKLQELLTQNTNLLRKTLNSSVIFNFPPPQVLLQVDGAK